jgi:hypothetical protein
MKKMAMVSALAMLAMGGQALAEDFDYHFLDAGLILADAGGSNDGVGFAVDGSTDLTGLYENATAFGGASYVDFDGGNLLNLHGGMGFHWPLASIVDFNGGVALEYQKVSGGGSSDLGFSLNAGVRARPFAPAWELDGGLQYVDIGQYEDTRVVLGARYTFRPGMSAGVHLNSGDIDYWTLSLRWDL